MGEVEKCPPSLFTVYDVVLEIAKKRKKELEEEKLPSGHTHLRSE